MNENQIILDNIEDQKEKLSKWKNNFKKTLLMNNSKNINIFLVKKEWFENYEQFISDINKKKSELIDFYNSNKYMDNSIIFEDKKNIKEYPELYVLNEEVANSLIRNSNTKKQIIKLEKYEGKYSDKFFFIEIKTTNNHLIYCLFFLDKMLELKQGYLDIKEDKKFDEIKISNKLKEVGNINNEVNINDNQYDLYIFEKRKNKNKNCNIDNKGIDNKEIYSKVNRKYIHKNLFKESSFKNKKELKNNEIIQNLDKSLLKPKKEIKMKRNKSSKLFNNNIKKHNFSINKGSLNLEEFFVKKSIHKRSVPGLIGLQNIGATCYMNATLQCFSNSSRFRTQLLKKELYQDLEKNKNTNKILSFALAEVLKNLWDILDHLIYSPENFKNVISNMNPLFKGIAANDPKDLVLFLLEKIHNELNNPINNNFNNNKKPNDFDFNEVYNNFVNYYSSKNKSLISDEFYGFINNYTTCGCCNIKIHNVQIINILFFPLEEVKKFKNYKHNNVSILDCFEYYEKMDIYPSFHCNYCQRNCQVYSQTNIIYSPKTLIINLNRGKGLEFDVNIIFEEYLNLKKYIYLKDSPYYYELTGVICHFGSNDEGGHFIAYCKNSENCEWYKYNDQFVTKCYFDEVKKARLPYVLFYSYVQTI